MEELSKIYKEMVLKFKRLSFPGKGIAKTRSRSRSRSFSQKSGVRVQVGFSGVGLSLLCWHNFENNRLQIW